MKIRSSYVANSSSSSFVVIGISVSEIENGKYIGNSSYEEDTTLEFEKKLCSVDNNLTYGGEYTNKLGIEIEKFIYKYKDAKIGDMKSIAANEINKVFGTSFTEKDMVYYEEGWYNG